MDKWKVHCEVGNHNLRATTETFINFMANEFERNLGYTYLRGYTSAMKPYLGDVDMHTVKKLLKGIHNIRPPKPRYSAIWDVNVVLSYIGAMTTVTDMDISCKLATLLMLLCGNRVNMLSHMKLTNMTLTDNECTFVFDDALKHTRPSFNSEAITFRAYPEDVSLCPVRTVLLYLERRAERCGEHELFITATKPYRAAQPDTLARWIKVLLGCAGIDTGKYSAHSCRAASTSAAVFAGVSIATILKSASWSNTGTFKTFYFRDIEKVYDLEEENFGKAVLRKYQVTNNSDV